MNITAMRLAAPDLPSATWTNISTMQLCPNNWCVNLCKKTRHHKTYITNDWSPFTLLSIQITGKLTSWCITVLFYASCTSYALYTRYTLNTLYTYNSPEDELRSDYSYFLTSSALFFRKSFSQVFEVTFYSNQANESRFLFSLRS